MVKSKFFLLSNTDVLTLIDISVMFFEKKRHSENYALIQCLFRSEK